MKSPCIKWSQKEITFLRTNLRSMKRRDLAACLGRTYVSINSKANALGLVHDHTWTEAEKSILRDRVAAGDTSAQIATLLPGRTRDAVENTRHKLGLSQQKLMPKAFDDLIRQKHVLEWSDSEIADEWNRLHPEQPSDHRNVGKHRQKMNLPAHGNSDRRRRRVAEKTREQLQRCGLGSLSELHRKVIQQRIAAMGWPTDLRMREAEILNLLWEQGPKTKREIASALKFPLHEMSRKMLKSNGCGGNYLADLMQRGLLISFPRVVPCGGQGKNVTLYSLPLSVQRGKVAS